MPLDNSTNSFCKIAGQEVRKATLRTDIEKRESWAIQSVAIRRCIAARKCVFTRLTLCIRQDVSELHALLALRKSCTATRFLKFGSAVRVQSVLINRLRVLTPPDIINSDAATHAAMLRMSSQPHGVTVTLHLGSCRAQMTAVDRCRFGQLLGCPMSGIVMQQQVVEPAACYNSTTAPFMFRPANAPRGPHRAESEYTEYHSMVAETARGW